jgi:hypothetical protein
VTLVDVTTLTAMAVGTSGLSENISINNKVFVVDLRGIHLIGVIIYSSVGYLNTAS